MITSFENMVVFRSMWNTLPSDVRNFRHNFKNIGQLFERNREKFGEKVMYKYMFFMHVHTYTHTFS